MPYPYLIKPVSGTRIERYLISYRTETPSIVLFGDGEIIATLRFYERGVPKGADTLLYDQAWLEFDRGISPTSSIYCATKIPCTWSTAAARTHTIAVSSENDDRILRIDVMERVGEGER